jgi:hypothetical protein
VVAAVGVFGHGQGDECPVVVAVPFRAAAAGGQPLPGRPGQAGGDVVGSLDAEAGRRPV